MFVSTFCKKSNLTGGSWRWKTLHTHRFIVGVWLISVNGSHRFFIFGFRQNILVCRVPVKERGRFFRVSTVIW